MNKKSKSKSKPSKIPNDEKPKTTYVKDAIEITENKVQQHQIEGKDLYAMIKNGEPLVHTCGRSNSASHTEINNMMNDKAEKCKSDIRNEKPICQTNQLKDKEIEIESYESEEPEVIIKDLRNIHQGDLVSNGHTDKLRQLSKENEKLLKITSQLKNEIDHLHRENKTIKLKKPQSEYNSGYLNPTIDELQKSNNEMNLKIKLLQIDNLEKDKNIKMLFDILQNIPKKLNDFILSQKTKHSVNDKTDILIKKLKDLNNSIGKVPPLPYPLIKINDKSKPSINNIKVLCRIKPGHGNCLSVPTNSTIFLPPFRHFEKGIGYSLNKVFDADSTQEEIFREISPILKFCFTGYNVCVLTYGQSGSGKTHTMLGKNDDPGIILLSMKELLKISLDSTSTVYKFYLSILEVYNENIYDLLNTSGDNKHLTPKSKVFIQDNGHSVQIKNVSEAEISNMKELEYYIAKSMKQRTPSGTSKNVNSSRSHFLVMIRICGVTRDMCETSNRGVLMLCDLAGSEQIEGLTDKEKNESKFINKSITILSRVLDALYKKLPVIPYRDSKLTHLLKPSLMGNAKCIFIATVCSQPENLLDTNRTLNVAKKVELISFNEINT